jgi:pyrrolidone-carboxylate peptidase
MNKIYKQNSDIKIHVTGFGPFEKFRKNISEKIAKLLYNEGIVTSYNRIEVSKYCIDKYLSSLNQKRNSLFIHFGLSPNTKNITIEFYSKNEFNGKKIDPKINIDHRIATKVPIRKIQFSKEVLIGYEPSNWFCNYLYYNSLNFVNTYCKNCFSLFIHLPLENIINIKDQYNAIKTIIMNLKKEVK